MWGMGRFSAVAVMVLASAGLWACDRGSSAPARAHAADEGSSSASRSYDSGGAARDGGYSDRRGDSRSSYAGNDAPREAIPLVDGKPMWSDNRRHTAEENADYHFHHDGPDFGATSEKDYLTKVHRFIEHPPSDVQTVSRSNGDKLLYDPKTNTFAVERKDGAPRTMFKPRDGEAYWKEQEAKAASGDDSYGGRSRRSDSSDSSDAG
jgi:pyocin large subunit-like protein